MVIEFRELYKEDKALFDAYYGRNYYENSHFNFTNLYMWRNPYNIRFNLEDDVLYLTAAFDGRPMALQPVGDAEKMPAAVAKIIEHFKSENLPLVFAGVEKNFADVLQNYSTASFELTPDRDNFDYVYEAASLINLAGRKYHSKKNHLNAFYKTYPEAEYLPITPEIVNLCKLELNSWYNAKKEGEARRSIDYERAAIIEVLESWEDFGLKGGAIALNGHVLAFTFGEQLNRDTAVIHVEKADPDIRGAYPAINQAFVAHEWEHMTFINREEDMGLEGLRKAKESYKPVKMIEKFNGALIE